MLDLSIFAFPSTTVIAIQLGVAADSTGAARGPDFTTDVEENASAFTIEAGTHSVVIPGPNVPGRISRDPTEPYTYSLPGSNADSRIFDFLTAFRALADADQDAATITISDGQTPQELVAPQASITDYVSVREGQAVDLEVSLTGGVYDDVVSRAWSITAGAGELSAITGETVTYTAGTYDATATRITVRCVVTVRGTGENARAGTATRTATEQFTIEPPPPALVAPTVSITDIVSIAQGQTATLRSTLQGGTYDTVVSRQWAVVSGPAQLSTSTGVSVDVTGGTYVADANLVTLRCRVTVRGTGEAAQAGTVTADGTETFLITPAPASAEDLLKLAESRSRDLSGDDSLYALEITHPAISTPVRIINATTVYTIDGNVYQPVAFHAADPKDYEEEVRHATLRIDNVGAVLTGWIHASDGGRGATMRIMKIVDNSGTPEVYWEQEMTVGLTDYNSREVHVRLADEPIVGKPGVLLRHDPDTSPGIFQ